MSASAESQERWSQFYDEASKRTGERERLAIVTAMKRRIWSAVFMASSMAFVIGLTTYFYRVLMRQQ
ncbi:MAG TPA: hypothetical protein VHJ20_01475 [Polyangia bacterium]|nr:hypothetical protein [Polyangia bacterium]